MSKDKPARDGFPNLRGRAEAAARTERSDGRDLSAEEVRRLVHDLRVHQIELEMQNDELRRAQRKRSTSSTSSWKALSTTRTCGWMCSMRRPMS